MFFIPDYLIFCRYWLIDRNNSGKESPPNFSSSASASTSAAPAKVYNVCNLVNGNLGDKSFFDSAEAGLAKLQEDGTLKKLSVKYFGEDVSVKQ